MGILPIAGAGAIVPAVIGRQQQQEREPGPVSKEDLDAAERIMGLDFNDEEDEMALGRVNGNLRTYQSLRELDIPLDTEPALIFDPRPIGFEMPEGSEAKPEDNWKGHARSSFKGVGGEISCQ